MLIQSPINLATPVRFTALLPAEIDVVIIGAGIAGISTAWHLARQGSRVLVIEKGRVAGEQSSRNWGWVRQTGRDPAELPIMMEALRWWQQLEALTGEQDLRFQAHGVTYLSDDDADGAVFEAFVRLAAQHGLNSRLLSGAEQQALLPTTRRGWSYALHTPGDGRAEPWVAVPALARALQRIGGIVIEQCAARAIDCQNGRVVAVVTELGTVKTERVLLAGGAWSSLFLGNLGVDLPQLSVRADALRAESSNVLCTGNAIDEYVGIARRADGGYTLALADYHEHFVGRDSLRFARVFRQALRQSWAQTRLRWRSPPFFPDHWRTPRRWQSDTISPFERLRVLDPTPDHASVQRLIDRVHARFDATSGWNVTNVWAGMIDTTPDFVPVLDAIAKVSGLFVATGFSGHGFGIGPGAGCVMADLMSARPVVHELSRFRFGRFQDGTRLAPGPS